MPSDTIIKLPRSPSWWVLTSGPEPDFARRQIGHKERVLVPASVHSHIRAGKD
jgi:hypothetical protein